MESDNQQENFLSAGNKVVTSLKYLAMTLFILMPFIGGWIGYKYAPEKVVEVEKVVIKEISKADSNPTEVTNIPTDIEGTEILSAYDSSKYRVVTVVQNPFFELEESNYSSLVVVAQRGSNDYRCGGKGFASPCYIFLEANESETETPKYVGPWYYGTIKPETIKFVSPTELSISVAEAIVCSSYKAEWKFDLNTGSSTRVSFEEFSDC